jgi:hypothetical protein
MKNLFYTTLYVKPETVESLEITREEFLLRFKYTLQLLALWHYDAKYADSVGPMYWEDAEWQGERPEECAANAVIDLILQRTPFPGLQKPEFVWIN